MIRHPVTKTFTLLHYISSNCTSLHLYTLNFFPFKLHPTTLHYTCRHLTSSHLNFTQMHFTTLHYTCRHLISSHLNFTQLHFTKLHYTCRHLTSSHLNFTQLHFTKLHYPLIWLNLSFPTAPYHLTSLHCTFRQFSPHFYYFHFTPFIIEMLLLWKKNHRTQIIKPGLNTGRFQSE
jgi:hypothetical protein